MVVICYVGGRCSIHYWNVNWNDNIREENIMELLILGICIGLALGLFNLKEEQC